MLSVSGGYLPKGYHVMRRLTDADSFYVLTDVPDGLKTFQRSPMKKGMEGDFETGNIRYKVRERYSFGWTDWRGVFRHRRALHKFSFNGKIKRGRGNSPLSF
jgi:hypothetical protein